MARYELVDGSSKKFWEVELEGEVLTTRWGKLGTAGQSLEKSFGSPAEALREHDKLVARKRKEGYTLAAPAPAAAATAGTDALEYDFADFDADDAYSLTCTQPDASGLRFTLTDASGRTTAVQVSSAAVEGARGTLHVAQDILYAGDQELKDGDQVTEWTAPFLVPRRFIRELLAHETSALHVLDSEASFTREKTLDADEKRLAKRFGGPVLKAVNDEMALLVSANPDLPLLLSRTQGEPMVTWKKGTLTGWPASAKQAPKAAAKPPAGPKGPKPTKEEALIAQLSDPSEGKRILAIKKLAAAPTAAGVGAMLKLTFDDKSPKVRAAASQARGRDNRPAFAEAAAALLEALLAAGPLAQVWAKSKRPDRPHHTGLRTVQMTEVYSLTYLLEKETLAARPALLAQLEAIACTLENDWEAIVLRQLLSMNFDSRACMDRSVKELHSADPDLAQVGREALYGLFYADPEAATSALAADLKDKRLASQDGQAFAAWLVEGFAPPQTSRWVKLCLQLWRAAPGARKKIEAFLTERVFGRWTDPATTDALLAEVDTEGEALMEVLLAIVRGDSRFFAQVRERWLPAKRLTGDVLASWIHVDLTGDSALDDSDVLQQQFKQLAEKEALRLAMAWQAELVGDDAFKQARLWKYLKTRKEPSFKPVVVKLLATSEQPDAGFDEELVAELKKAAKP